MYLSMYVLLLLTSTSVFFTVPSLFQVLSSSVFFWGTGAIYIYDEENNSEQHDDTLKLWTNMVWDGALCCQHGS